MNADTQHSSRHAAKQSTAARHTSDHRASFATRLWRRLVRLVSRRSAVSAVQPLSIDRTPDELPLDNAPTDSPSGDLHVLVERMLAQHRYSLLMRPQIAGNLTEQQRQLTMQMQSEGMCIVPPGEVALESPMAPLAEAGDAPETDEEDALDRPSSQVVQVDAYYIDRYVVTNRQFQQFVDAGGYEQMAIWDREIWPAVLDFVDSTGQPGPRFWKNGRCERGQEDHPVVGVSWYEASAYARWVGKRLPTDAEWVKAASWPIVLPGNQRVQRRYPWGEAMDRSRANLWGSGPDHTVPVEQFPQGASVGGAHQLIGNVWEWLDGDYVLDDDPEVASACETALKSLRGGAFDTYLDVQATCQFQSADHPLARKHNIGFRCVIGACDLAIPNEEPPADELDQPDEPELTEATV